MQMQMQMQQLAQPRFCARHRRALAHQPRTLSSPCRSVANGNGISSCPSPAETARTVADLCQEGALCTLSADGRPLASPVAYKLDKEGNPLLQVLSGSPEAANIAAGGRCSLLVQPAAFPARGVASVALQGAAAAADADAADAAGEGVSLYKLDVDSVVYYGGLDLASHGQQVSGDDYRAAEPDLLRNAAAGLIETWNSERAEDVYRIVANHLGAPLIEMLYAELLWVDRLGLYVRAELLGRAPAVVRVPFYRPVLDERDARSVVTMASHISWEAEKRYTPPPVATPTPAGSNN